MAHALDPSVRSPMAGGVDSPTAASMAAPFEAPLEDPLDGRLDAPLQAPLESAVDPAFDAPFGPAMAAPVERRAPTPHGRRRRAAWRGAGKPALDMSELEREFHETGQLCEESYCQLEDAGVPRRTVDAFIDGQRLRAEAFTRDVYAISGGEERYAAMMDWAEATLSPGEWAAYEASLAGTPEQMRLAIDGLNAAYTRAVGDPVQLVGGGAPVVGARFESAQQVVEAMRDPRYKSDEAYRRQVQQRLARSNVF